MTYQADSESVYSLDSTSVPASPLSVVSPIVGTILAKTVNQTDKYSQSEGTISLIFIEYRRQVMVYVSFLYCRCRWGVRPPISRQWMTAVTTPWLLWTTLTIPQVCGISWLKKFQLFLKIQTGCLKENLNLQSLTFIIDCFFILVHVN